MLQVSRYNNMRVTSLFFLPLRLDHTWHQKAVSVLLVTDLPIISDFWVFCVCFSAQYEYIPYQSTVFFAKMPISYPFEPPSVARLRPSDDPPPLPSWCLGISRWIPLVGEYGSLASLRTTGVHFVFANRYASLHYSEPPGCGPLLS